MTWKEFLIGLMWVIILLIIAVIVGIGLAKYNNQNI